MNTPPTLANQTGSTTRKDHEKRRLVVVASGKGGTGNSFFSRVLLDYYTERDREVIAVDTHHGRSTFYTFLHDEKLCRYCDLGEANAFNNLIELCLGHKSVLVDLSFGEFGRFERWLLDSGFTELARGNGIELTFVLVVGAEPETVAIISRGLEAVKNIGQVLVVKNLRNKASRWSDDQEQFVAALAQGSAVITLPELDRDTALILTVSCLRFCDALPGGSKRDKVSQAESWHVQKFWSHVKSELARVEKHLF